MPEAVKLGFSAICELTSTFNPKEHSGWGPKLVWVNTEADSTDVLDLNPSHIWQSCTLWHQFTKKRQCTNLTFQLYTLLSTILEPNSQKLEM